MTSTAWRGRHAIVVCVLAVLTAALYAQTLDDEWHLDDLGQLTPTVRELAPHVAPEHYRGIVVLWLWTMDYAIGGEDPTNYHVTNAVIHWATSASVYWLAWLLVPPGRSRRLAAATAAAIFCVHPLATQSVAYLTQRSTSLAAFLFLVSVASWIEFRRRSGARATLALVASFAAFGLGLHAKHLAVLVPIALFAYEALFAAPPRRRALVTILPFVAWSIWRLVEFGPRIEGAHRWGDQGDVATGPRLSRFEYAISQPRSVVSYVRLFVLPVGQNLDTDVRPVPSAASAEFLGPVGLLLALAALGGRVRRSQPQAAFGIALFFLALVPTSSLVPSADLSFEHRAYLPMAGLCLGLMPLVIGLHAMSARGAAVTVVATITVLAALCSRRLAVWDTELSLWSDVVAKSPGKSRPHVNLGLALQSAGRLDEAERHYVHALEIQPGYAFALNNLGNVSRARGRPGEAEGLFHRALEARPGYVGPRINLGNLALDRGDLDAAEAWYRDAITAGPEAAEARYNLAKVMEGKGRWGEAIAEYERVVAARPRDARFVNDLGCARLSAGDAAGAERDLRNASRLDPEWGAVWYNLGLALDALGRGDEARRAYERALELEPGLAPARARLGR